MSIYKYADSDSATTEKENEEQNVTTPYVSPTRKFPDSKDYNKEHEKTLTNYKGGE